MLTYLTGRNYDDWDVLVKSPEEKYIPTEASYSKLADGMIKKHETRNGILIGVIAIVGLGSLLGLGQVRKEV